MRGRRVGVRRSRDKVLADCEGHHSGGRELSLTQIRVQETDGVILIQQPVDQVPAQREAALKCR